MLWHTVKVKFQTSAEAEAVRMGQSRTGFDGRWGMEAGGGEVRSEVYLRH